MAVFKTGYSEVNDQNQFVCMHMQNTSKIYIPSHCLNKVIGVFATLLYAFTFCGKEMITKYEGIQAEFF